VSGWWLVLPAAGGVVGMRGSASLRRPRARCPVPPSHQPLATSLFCGLD
jgi:hypothetical protein